MTDDLEKRLTDYFGLSRSQERAYDTKSAFHKDLRRCNQAEAELMALALYLQNPRRAWAAILNNSTEETIDPLTIVAVDTLYRQHAELVESGEKDVGVLARLAMLAAGIIANAPKDRTADEMLHLTDFCDLLSGNGKMDKWYRDLGIGDEIDRLLVEGVADPIVQDRFRELLRRDFVLDRHTGDGAMRPRGRKQNTYVGESHWDGPATLCVNRTLAYVEWREKVYDRIRGWALDLLRKREERPA